MKLNPILTGGVALIVGIGIGGAFTEDTPAPPVEPAGPSAACIEANESLEFVADWTEDFADMVEAAILEAESDNEYLERRAWRRVENHHLKLNAAMTGYRNVITECKAS